MESQLIWAPDLEHGYVLGRVVDIGVGQLANIRLEPQPLPPIVGGYAKSSPTHSGGGGGGKKIEASLEQVYPTENDLSKDYDDNCSLMYLNEANLLHNVRLRYAQNKIYTYVANILIALNPYDDLNAKLYSTEVLRSYKGKSLGKMPPHVFAIADKAFHDMKRTGQSQSVIVSGESGAGKTESTKYILRYLCESWSGATSAEAASATSVKIEQLILEANPLLEAFGNAKTARNNNSSRFGKFIEIYFDRFATLAGAKRQDFTVAGGHIRHYLLEKSRICGQIGGSERNYHIFYQLCVGLPQSEWTRLKLAPPDAFNYLKKGCTRYFLSPQENDRQVGGERKSAQHQAEGPINDSIVNDLADFRSMDAALDHFGVSGEEKCTIYQIVAAILHLGNITFEEAPDGTSGGCRICIDPITQQALRNTSTLLGVDQQELQQCLQSRIMQTNKGGFKGSVIMVPLRVHEAANARDALAKAIYSRLFDYIVTKIVNRALPMNSNVSNVQKLSNSASSSSPSPSSQEYSIGVLDIAGFEYFQTNSFEQFCINYCNEKLQNFFNERILNDEQQLYEVEGLGIRRIKYVDNRDCIELFEAKGCGIFDLLDEESRLSRMPQHFTETVHRRNKDRFRLDIPRKSKLKSHRELRDNEGFLIRHFAGAVCYQTAQFIEKNNDTLHTNLAFLMIESNQSMLKSLFQESPSSKSAQGGGNFIVSQALTDKSVKLSAESVGSKFRKQLADLIAKLESTGTHFVRCIKPNVHMVAKQFDGACILSQLKCSGMGSVLELMQHGYPSRATYQAIHDLYSPYLPMKLTKLEARHFCQALVKSLGLSEQKDVRFGVTKVFFRPGRFAEFDLLLKSDDPAQLDRLVQRVQRWLIVTRWKRVQWCTLSVIKLTNKITYRRQCIIAIQKYIRMYLEKQRYRPRYMARIELRKLGAHLRQLGTLVEKIQVEPKRFDFVQRLKVLSLKIDELIVQKFGLPPSPPSSPVVVPPPKLSKSTITTILDSVRGEIDSLLSELQHTISEQERVQRMQAQLEAERKLREAEEERQRQQEELRKRKAEFEEQRRKQAIEMEQKVARAKANGIQPVPATTEMSGQQQLQQTRGTNTLVTTCTQTDPTEPTSLMLDLNEEAQRQRQAEYFKRREQERRDYELALRLAQQDQDDDGSSGSSSGSSSVDDHHSSPTLSHHHNVAIASQAGSYVGSNNNSGSMKKKHNLESWNYAQLRDTINTSSDIELLEACREEFHRRLKVYHKWKYQMNANRQGGGGGGGQQQQQQQNVQGSSSGSVTSNTNGGEQQQQKQQSGRAPDIVMDTFYNADMLGVQMLIGEPVLVNELGTTMNDNTGKREREQRYFRLPFARKSGQSKGLWYAHFDGRWIARQMEIHPEREPILLVAGVNDLQMCELSLEETGLTSKRGVEIMGEEFEAEWQKNGGKPYTKHLTNL